jgi:hypothetical protein
MDDCAFSRHTVDCAQQYCTMTDQTLGKLGIHGRWFVDGYGRRVILRGVNLGGDCKVPAPRGGTNFPSDFLDHRTVSFIGRPFPLADAPQHFERLRHWGFNCLRLLTTWEAVSHAGPDQFDTAYLDYFARICEMAGEYGFYVFVDFHQDVWSRMSGGDGAPGWTFEAVGLDFTRFHAAGAALVMQHAYDYARGGRQEDRYPQMCWFSNHRRPANGIMWSLFFAGATLTPDCRIDGRNVQDYLQHHYRAAMHQVALRLKDMPHVLGFDSLNEPGIGWLGQPLFRDYLARQPETPEPVRFGLAISPLDGLLAARGIPRMVPEVRFDRTTRTLETVREVPLNPDGVSIWRDGVPCPFEAAGAYTLENNGTPLDDAFFTHQGSHRFDVEADFLVPFFHSVAETIRAVREDWLLFAEVSPFRTHTAGLPPGMPERTVNASHWYDARTLQGKRFAPREFEHAADRAAGEETVRARYVSELSRVEAAGTPLSAHGAPTIVGEFGIPFDLDQGAAYAAWNAGDHGDAPWADHTLALSLMYDAMDRLLLSSAQWNYTASNRNDAAIGDGWNQEDLSIYSVDQEDAARGADSGGRAVRGFSRPYARRVQGTPRSVSFDPARAEFKLVFEADPAIAAPTEIFLPAIHYPQTPAIAAEGCRISSPREGVVAVSAETPGLKTVIVKPAS